MVVLVGGWGIDPSFGIACLKERYPEDHCHYVCPTQNAIEQVPKGVDILIGYSLGGRLIQRLSALQDIPQVQFLAPAFSIVKEDGFGGKIPRRTLKAMLASFKRDPLKQLQIFLSFIGCNENPHRLPYVLSDLSWGLEALIGSELPEVANPCSVLVGEQDPLVDGIPLKNLFPGAVTVVPGMGHGLSDLLKAL